MSEPSSKDIAAAESRGPINPTPGTPVLTFIPQEIFSGWELLPSWCGTSTNIGDSNAPSNP